MCIFKTARNMAAIPHYDLTLDAAKIEDGAKEIIRRLRPSWNLQSLQFQQFTEGITNILVGCYQPDCKDDMVLVRVFGQKTELIIDRKAEKETFILLSAAGCAPPLYCTFNNGMAYGFVKGKPLDEAMVTDEKIRALIAKEMAKLHSLKNDSRGGNSPPKQFVVQKILNFLSEVPESFPDEKKQKLFAEKLKSKAALQKEFEEFRKHLEAMRCDVVFSHNDLLLQNIVYDSQTDKVGFIDYEYAFYNLQGFDIGNHFNEYVGMDIDLDYKTKYPKQEYQLSWIRIYLEEYYRLTGKQTTPDALNTDVERLYVQVNKCALASHFFWGCWALIQAAHSTIDFDYLGYAVTRFGEYFRRQDEFLALKEPQESSIVQSQS